MKKNLFMLRVAEHWNRLPSEVVSLPFWRHSKHTWMHSSAPCSRWPGRFGLRAALQCKCCTFPSKLLKKLKAVVNLLNIVFILTTQYYLNYLFCENAASFIKEMSWSLPYSCETVQVRCQGAKGKIPDLSICFLPWNFNIFISLLGRQPPKVCCLVAVASACVKNTYLACFVRSHQFPPCQWCREMKRRFPKIALFTCFDIFSVVMLEKEIEIFQNLLSPTSHYIGKLSYFKEA